MTKRMLIDATHPEETRVVVLDGQDLEHFDIETATRRLLKGNIYLAKVVRVEPSLQAAFVEYGGGRHGFLAFDEIHPDYYQIPVADRQRLLEEVARQAAEDDEDEPRAKPERRERREVAQPLAVGAAPRVDASADASLPAGDPPATPPPEPADPPSPDAPHTPVEEPPGEDGAPIRAEPECAAFDVGGQALGWNAGVLDAPATSEPAGVATLVAEPAQEPATQLADHAEVPALDTESAGSDVGLDGPRPDPDQPEDPRGPEPEDLGGVDLPEPEQVGGDDPAERPRRARSLRSYTIQEVIRRRQIMLVQVTKEERGGKGAALTTYISLAGRYSVLMPNSPRGGGVSRKITSAADRRRLKEVTAESGLPDGMSLIIRTAGAARPKAEIARDIDYLLRTWDDIRETTLASVAPTLIHEEASLIKRSVRDIYARDFEDILVDGQDGWRAARQFINTLIPGHAKKVQLWREPQKLFAKFGVDAQLDAIMQPRVQLRSGGYLVINQTEALVAIDVNSGRSTRERNIEETAFRTNCEAAEEVARQLRLRDLAGLIVIDFIDMEVRKNIGIVEKRLKDALHDDRARIQVGSISHFGLMEMSRQRLRPSVTEQSAAPCPHCGGSGHIRSNESAAIAVLRQIEDEGAKRRAGEIVCHVATTVALYLMNNMRDRVADIERRFAMRVLFSGDDALIPPDIRIDRIGPPNTAAEFAPPSVTDAEFLDEVSEADDVIVDEDEAAADTEGGEVDEAGRERVRGRRRRRGRGRREDGPEEVREDGRDDRRVTATLTGALEGLAAETPDGFAPGVAPADTSQAAAGAEPDSNNRPAAPGADSETSDDTPAERERRRRRRGGRRRRRDGTAPDVSAPDAEQPEVPELSDPRGVPAYRGPTPADPFNNVPFDIFDVMEQAEAVEADRRRMPGGPGSPEAGLAAVPTSPMPEPSVSAPLSLDGATHTLASVTRLPEPSSVSSATDPTPTEVETRAMTVPPEVDPVTAVAHGADLSIAVPEQSPVSSAPVNPSMPENAEPTEGMKIQPTLVDAVADDVPRKRGWWRR